jgi:hypothetical protein
MSHSWRYCQFVKMMLNLIPRQRLAWHAPRASDHGGFRIMSVYHALQYGLREKTISLGHYTRSYAVLETLSLQCSWYSFPSSVWLSLAWFAGERETMDWKGSKCSNSLSWEKANKDLLEDITELDPEENKNPQMTKKYKYQKWVWSLVKMTQGYDRR